MKVALELLCVCVLFFLFFFSFSLFLARVAGFLSAEGQRTGDREYKIGTWIYTILDASNLLQRLG